MLSGVYHVTPLLQLGIRGNRGCLVGNQDIPGKNQRAALETPGDPRAAIAAKGSCPQAARGDAAHVPPLCSKSLGSEAVPFQDRLAQVQLLYGAKRVSNAGGHDPCTGLPTFTRAYASRLKATRENYIQRRQGPEPEVICNPWRDSPRPPSAASVLRGDIARSAPRGGGGRVQPGQGLFGSRWLQRVVSRQHSSGPLKYTVTCIGVIGCGQHCCG